MSESRRHRAAAATAPRSGKWKGTTTEKHTVTFSVSSNRARANDFVTMLGYNGTRGPEAVPKFTVHIATMAITKKRSFSPWTTSTLLTFTGKILVSGKFARTNASGTVSEPSSACVSPARQGLQRDVLREARLTARAPGTPPSGRVSGVYRWASSRQTRAPWRVRRARQGALVTAVLLDDLELPHRAAAGEVVRRGDLD